MKYRIIYESHTALYNVLVQSCDDYLKEILNNKGCVEYRRGDSSYKRLVDSLYQSDYCPPIFFEDPILRVAVVKEEG